MTDIVGKIEDAIEDEVKKASEELRIAQEEHDRWDRMETELTELRGQLAGHQRLHESAEADREKMMSEHQAYREKMDTVLTELSERVKTVEDMEIVEETPPVIPEPEPEPEVEVEAEVPVEEDPLASEESGNKKNYQLV